MDVIDKLAIADLVGEPVPGKFGSCCHQLGDSPENRMVGPEDTNVIPTGIKIDPCRGGMPVGIPLISRGRPTNPARIPVGASAAWYYTSRRPAPAQACPGYGGLSHTVPASRSCRYPVLR